MAPRPQQGTTSDLTGHAALVTAAAGGAGRVIARTLHGAGARVFACDVDEDGLAALAADAPGIETATCDAGDPAAIGRTCDLAARRLDAPITLLVNNVGIAGPTAAIEDVRLADWNAVLQVNLTGHFLFAQGVIPAMKRAGGGLIVNISSASAATGLPMRLPYVVSKSAVLGLTRNMARELGPDGIRVNAILPGPIRGERIERVIAEKSRALGVSEADYAASLVRYTSLRTLVEPDDIAATVAFLASRGGARITGQLIGVDGNQEWEE